MALSPSLESEIPTAPRSASPPPHPAEWIPLLLEGILLGLLFLRTIYPDLLRGQLLPCLVLGLAPGCAWRLLGYPSLSAHRFGVALGLVTFIIADGKIDLHRLGDVARRWDLLPVILLLVAIQPFLGAARWKILLQAQGIGLSFFQSLRLVLVGIFFNAFLPGATGGDLYRIVYVGRVHNNSAGATTSVILDRFLGLPSLVLLVTVAAAFHPAFLSHLPHVQVYLGIIAFLALISLLLLLYLFLGSFYVLEWMERWEKRLPGGAVLMRLSEAIAAYRGHGRALLGVLGIGLLSHLVTMGTCYLIGLAVDLRTLGPGMYMLLVPMGLAVNSLPISPGGVGVGEGAFYVLFDAASPGCGAKGAVVMLCLRAGLLLTGLGGGLLYAFGRHALPSPLPPKEEVWKEVGAV